MTTKKPALTSADLVEFVLAHYLVTGDPVRNAEAMANFGTNGAKIAALAWEAHADLDTTEVEVGVGPYANYTGKVKAAPALLPSRRLLARRLKAALEGTMPRCHHGNLAEDCNECHSDPEGLAA